MQRQTTSPSLLAIAVLTVLASSANADTNANTNTNTTATELPTVVVKGDHHPKHPTSAVSATRTDSRLLDVPQSVSAVTSVELTERNVGSVNEALQMIAGVSATMGEGRRDQVNIRGFSALNDQYLDGMRDDAPYYRDLVNVERLEVLKGPASVLFGRGSGGGLINRISKKPDFDAAVGTTSLGLGSYDYRRGTVDIGQPNQTNDTAWRVNAAVENSESFRRYFFLDRYVLAPSAAWRIGDNGTLMVQSEFLKDQRLPDRGITGLNGRPADVDISTYYGDPSRDVLDTRAAEFRVAYEDTLTNGWTLRNTLVRQDVDTTYYNTYANGPTNDGTRVTRGQYNGDSDSTNWFDQFELVSEFSGSHIQHVVLAGMEIGQQTRASQRYNGTAATVALIDPDLSIGSQPSNTLAISNDFTGDTLAFYLQDQIELSSHWKALLGLRWDRYTQTLYNQLSPSTPPLERTDIQTSPRVGLVWQPVNTQSIYASWSHSFQPSGDGLSLANNTTDLEPEQSALREIGWKAEWMNGQLTSTVALFDQVRDNLRTTDPLDPTRLIQIGEQRTRGLELELTGTLSERLDLRASYTHLNAEITQSNDKQSGVALVGNQPSNVPENSASMWALYQVNGNFDIGLGTVAVGERFTANDNLVRMPGYVRADALLRWHNGTHELALNLKNIGNTNYYETAHTTHQIMPGAPRNATLSWRLNF